MKDICFPYQGAFMHEYFGWHINDKRLLYSRERRRQTVSVLEIDMRKAYDHAIYIGHLLHLLRGEGFGKQWCSRM